MSPLRRIPLPTLLALLLVFGGLLLSLGMAIEQESRQRDAWSALRDAIQKRDNLVASLIYEIKTESRYPDVPGAAQLYATQKTCAEGGLANTLNVLSLCVVEIEGQIRGQQSALSEIGRTGATADRRRVLFLALDRSLDEIRSSCQRVHELWLRRPLFGRPFSWLLARHDWSAARVCK